MKPDPEYLEALRRSGRCRGYYRTRPDRWPTPPRDARCSPLGADGSAYAGGPAMPGWEPIAEDDLPGIERDAFASLIHCGHLSPGQLVPWRGERSAFLLDLVREVPESDIACRVAIAVLESVELAKRRDAAGAFAALAATVAELSLSNAVRIVDAQARGAKAGGEANRLARRGRPATVAPEMREALRLEAAEIRSAHPRWGARAVARELARRCARSSEPERARVAALSEQRLAELLRV